MLPSFGAADVFSLAAGFSLVFIFSSIVAIKTVFWRRFAHFYFYFSITQRAERMRNNNRRHRP